MAPAWLSWSAHPWAPWDGGTEAWSCWGASPLQGGAETRSSWGASPWEPQRDAHTAEEATAAERSSATQPKKLPQQKDVLHSRRNSRSRKKFCHTAEEDPAAERCPATQPKKLRGRLAPFVTLQPKKLPPFQTEAPLEVRCAKISNGMLEFETRYLFGLKCRTCDYRTNAKFRLKCGIFADWPLWKDHWIQSDRLYCGHCFEELKQKGECPIHPGSNCDMAHEDIADFMAGIEDRSKECTIQRIEEQLIQSIKNEEILLNCFAEAKRKEAKKKEERLARKKLLLIYFAEREQQDTSRKSRYTPR